jgi:ATP-dependent RNA helicase DeaD
MTYQEQDKKSFGDLGLDDALLRAVIDEGFTTPTPIQVATIPLLLEGRDVVGKARTGTGKTAAYALPLLQSLDLRSQKVQAVVLTPTRELAIQVTESLLAYGRYMPRLRVLPVYGGQQIGIQLRALQPAPHVIVGTPGRVMDHLRRNTLKLDTVHNLVLDEADEMLRMGFLEDVEWILEHTPKSRRTALFSATMPPPIMNVARRHLDNPEVITIEPPAQAAIEQRYIRLKARDKLLALQRILEAEPCEGVLVFVRTRVDCSSLTDALLARGHRVEALHGDLSQAQREVVMSRFKEGHVEVVIGTDVAARGLDVDHITHVVNFDMPHDVDTYVHRIGRTGRAGRTGVAILFVEPSEFSKLKLLERRTNQTITAMEIPTVQEIADRKVERFKDEIRRVLNTERLDLHYRVVKELMAEGLHMTELAAAAAFLTGGLKLDPPAPVQAAKIATDERERPARPPKPTKQRPQSKLVRADKRRS